MILILDAGTGKIVDVNPFLVEMLGYSKEQFLEKASWEIGVFKDIVANKENLNELQQKRDVRYENLPLETAHGDIVEVEFISNVYLVGNHKVIQCTIRNITEQRIAEELIQTLLAETLDNPMAIAALGDAGSRIQSMMVLYNRLYQSTSFDSVPVLSYLSSLIDEILANFPNSKSIKVNKIMDDFILDAKVLQPLGIIINEPVTNIMKYAFDGRECGATTVSALSKGRLLSFIIEDNGNGIPESVDFASSPRNRDRGSPQGSIPAHRTEDSRMTRALREGPSSPRRSSRAHSTAPATGATSRMRKRALSPRPSLTFRLKLSTRMAESALTKREPIMTISIGRPSGKASCRAAPRADSPAFLPIPARMSPATRSPSRATWKAAFARVRTGMAPSMYAWNSSRASPPPRVRRRAPVRAVACPQR